MRTPALRDPMARFLLRPVKETRVPPSCPSVTAPAGVPGVLTASSSLRSTLPPSFPLKAHGPASTDAAQSQPRGAKNRKVTVTFGASVGSIAVMMIGVGLFLCWRHRHHQQIFFDVNDQYDPEVRLGHLRRFSFKELRVATDMFGCSSQSPEALWILYNRE